MSDRGDGGGGGPVMSAMSAEEFSAFRARSVIEYGASLARVNGLSREAGLAAAEVQFNTHLPDGPATKNHYFFHLKAAGSIVGTLWFGVRTEHSRSRIFIFDIMTDERHRGSGHGSFMLKWLESKTRELGFSEIALHVFGSNTGARRLYERLGYDVTSVYMAKKV